MRIITGVVFIASFLFSCSKSKVNPPAAVGPVPSPAQLEWHRMEMNAFIHFTINTFTDLEWGMGNESPSSFQPTAFDAEQWVKVLSEAGFKGIVLTCKHHDGFCLWPSRHTSHNISNSPFQNGKGDVVKAVSDACKKFNLKFGVYLSPWDRNHAGYGSKEYIQYYRDQLNELFTTYGPIFEMWLDGANGGTGYYGGANEKRSIDGSTYYEWPATIERVRKMEPEVIFFSDAGPGVRWVGNERGSAGETNWNTISTDTLFAGKGGIEKLLNTGDENGTHWVPAETDVSIRPGWFYHQREDSLVKSPHRLFEIYLSSVGRGSTLLLNVPPDKRGLIHENDVRALQGFRSILDATFDENIAAEVAVKASAVRGDDPLYNGSQAVDDNQDTYWTVDDEITTPNLEITLRQPAQADYVVLQEHIQLGQRVRSFVIEGWINNAWVEFARGTTIGYKRILPLRQPAPTDRFRLSIADSKACPLISTFALY